MILWSHHRTEADMSCAPIARRRLAMVEERVPHTLAAVFRQQAALTEIED